MMAFVSGLLIGLAIGATIAVVAVRRVKSTADRRLQMLRRVLG